MTDDRLRPGTRHCKCGACGEYFNSPKTFDMHRAGAGQERFCEDPAKLVDKNGIARLRLNVAGLWASTRVYR